MIQIQPVNATVSVQHQRANCGKCNTQKVYVYLCATCQEECCSNCIKAIPIAGEIYMFCQGCTWKIAKYWQYVQ